MQKIITNALIYAHYEQLISVEISKGLGNMDLDLLRHYKSVSQKALRNEFN